ncbi:MAG: hypothetical protein LC785_01090 [Acidobacteria bacterium]|nr:hypothetical protein [Acidobacteriota bacterium]MCA1640582.1 hypothetical protein [Acidobacteriota bacterium]
MSEILEEVIEEVKALPPDQQEKFRRLVGLLIGLFLVGIGMELTGKTISLTPDEMRQLRDELDAVTGGTSGPDERRKAVRSVRGKYAHLPTGSEAFAARKVEEISLEDRRSIR